MWGRKKKTILCDEATAESCHAGVIACVNRTAHHWCKRLSVVRKCGVARGGGSEGKDFEINCGGNVAIGGSRQLVTTAWWTFEHVQTEKVEARDGAAALCRRRT